MLVLDVLTTVTAGRTLEAAIRTLVGLKVAVSVHYADMLADL